MWRKEDSVVTVLLAALALRACVEGAVGYFKKARAAYGPPRPLSPRTPKQPHRSTLLPGPAARCLPG